MKNPTEILIDNLLECLRSAQRYYLFGAVTSGFCAMIAFAPFLGHIYQTIPVPVIGVDISPEGAIPIAASFSFISGLGYHILASFG